jgi:hypothetical protein
MDKQSIFDERCYLCAFLHLRLAGVRVFTGVLKVNRAESMAYKINYLNSENWQFRQ